jgi:molecular chaperone DnaK (HSP70)
LLIGDSSRIPKVQQLLYAYFGGIEFYKGLYFDECVVTGATIFTKNTSERPLLLSVIPDTLGIGLADGTVETIIFRNTTIPTLKG